MKDINLLKQMFDFIEQHEGLRTPLIFKLLHEPETITAEDLHVDEDLNLRNTPITSLPEGLSVGGSLDLWGTSITSLPHGLSVGKWLNLMGTPITSLPEGLTVGGSLYLQRTPLAKQYSAEEIRAMIESKGGKVAGGIYV